MIPEVFRPMAAHCARRKMTAANFHSSSVRKSFQMGQETGGRGTRQGRTERAHDKETSPTRDVRSHSEALQTAPRAREQIIHCVQCWAALPHIKAGLKPCGRGGVRKEQEKAPENINLIAKPKGRPQKCNTRRRNSFWTIPRSSCTPGEPKIAEFSCVRRMRYGTTSSIGP